MRFTDIIDVCSENVRVVKDCEFDSLYLVGKPYEESRNYISFVGSVKFIDDFLAHPICGAICTEEVAAALADKYDGGILIAPTPKTAFFEIHNHFAENLMKFEASDISPKAIIHPSAIIAEKGVSIGENTYIGAHTVIKEGTYIGDNCIIREGCVVGGPAFYYFGTDEGRRLVTSTGITRIGNNVELHANVVVEKAVMYGETVIGDNTKIDNGVVVGHDVNIGRNCTIAGNTDIAGGVVIGEDTFMGVLTAVAPNIVIGKGAKLSSGAIVTKAVADGQHVSGNFAIAHDKYVKHIKEISK